LGLQQLRADAILRSDEIFDELPYNLTCTLVGFPVVVALVFFFMTVPARTEAAEVPPGGGYRADCSPSTNSANGIATPVCINGYFANSWRTKWQIFIRKCAMRTSSTLFFQMEQNRYFDVVEKMI
jgi:hypothetical protein